MYVRRIRMQLITKKRIHAASVASQVLPHIKDTYITTFYIHILL